MKSDSKPIPRPVPDYFFDHYKILVGKTVRAVCVSKPDLSDEFGSRENEYGLLFTDGTAAWIMCDPEGNGPGFLDIQPPTTEEKK